LFCAFAEGREWEAILPVSDYAIAQARRAENPSKCFLTCAPPALTFREPVAIAEKFIAKAFGRFVIDTNRRALATA